MFFKNMISLGFPNLHILASSKCLANLNKIYIDFYEKIPTMHRTLYTLLLYLVLPFVPLKLLWRGIKQPEYRAHWAERFGFFKHQINKPVISIHCVSVGETHAAAPLIQALLKEYPDHQILITHGTPTGRETSTALFGDQVMRAYLPYDLPGAVKRFLSHFKPAMVILMETELWFNLIDQCHRQKVPAVLINARLSEKSAKGYAKVRTLTKTALSQQTLISAQTQADADRFNSFGVNASVSGNLKFDVAIAKHLITQGQMLKQNIGKPVFVAASTREGEEALLIGTIQALIQQGIFVMLVPRHPQRFNEVAALLTANHLSFVRKSELDLSIPITQPIMLGDTMGEMASYYAAADVAFIGGSLLPLGGQNMIEPCAVGTPVLFGPHTFNFSLVANQIIEAGVGKRVQNAAALTKTVQELLSSSSDQRDQMQARAKAFVAQHQGATDNYLALLRPHIAPTQG